MLKAQFIRAYSPCQLQTGGRARLARPTLSHPRIVRRLAQPSEPGTGASIPEDDDLPPELRDLQINEDGFLIDTKTGKVINEMGATRFDVAVRALRGELDPPNWVENSERTPGVLLSALYQFPRPYLFQVVGRFTAAASASTMHVDDGRPSSSSPSPSSSSSSSSIAAVAATGDADADVAVKCPGRGPDKEAFVRDVRAVISRVTQVPVEDNQVEVKERLSGKYVSLSVDVVVRAPELVSMVYDELAKDPRVIMRF